MSDSFDVIQAFVDDEPVDPVELERALADPDGRAHLIDIVVLRNLARQSVPVMPALAARRPRRAGWLPAAAAIALATGLGGYLAGGRAARPQPPATQDAAASAAVGGTTTAPAPAYVIRLEPGVDWTERTGGR
jgi:hypothetical protein